jgi:hypothetical protein
MGIIANIIMNAGKKIAAAANAAPTSPAAL